MQPPLRIAVLECDTPLDRTRSVYGSYGGVFKALLASGAKALAEDTGTKPVELDITTYDVVAAETYPKLEDIDAVLLTGSRQNAFDNAPWIEKLVSLTKSILETQSRVRIIGVCFGHQIVGRAMGVKVDRSTKGWEISVMPQTLSPKGQELFGVKELSLHQMHRDVVYTYPSQVEQLGSSPLCDVQGMYIKNRLITVQGHPEFTKEIVTELLESRHKAGVFDDTMYEDGIARVGNRHDGVAVARAFLKFLLEE